MADASIWNASFFFSFVSYAQNHLYDMKGRSQFENESHLLLQIWTHKAYSSQNGFLVWPYQKAEHETNPALQRFPDLQTYHHRAALTEMDIAEGEVRPSVQTYHLG